MVAFAARATNGGPFLSLSMLRWLLLIALHCSIARCKRYEIKWQSNSEAFRSPEPLNYREFRFADVLTFICPSNSEVSAIHLIESEEATLSCRLPSTETTLANCLKPNETITIRLRAFSPTPGGFEFRANRHYYLLYDHNYVDRIVHEPSLNGFVVSRPLPPDHPNPPLEYYPYPESGHLNQGNHGGYQYENAATAAQRRLPTAPYYGYPYPPPYIVSASGNVGGFVSSSLPNGRRRGESASDDDDPARLQSQGGGDSGYRRESRITIDSGRFDYDVKIGDGEKADYLIGYEVNEYGSDATSTYGQKSVLKLPMLLFANCIAMFAVLIWR